MIRISALALALVLAASSAFAADPTPVGGLGATRLAAPAAALPAGGGADVFGILIGMLRDAQQEHREDKQMARQLNQLMQGNRARSAANNTDATDTGRREQEEKLRALMAQQDETERKLGKLEAALNKYRSLRVGTPATTTLKPGAVTRPATTLAPATTTPATGLPRTTKKLGLMPAGGGTTAPTPPDTKP